MIGAYLQLGIGRERVSREQKWLVHVPFSIYLGWISVATIVNVASALYISGWNGWGLSAEGWTMIMLIVGAVVAATVAIRRADTAFTLVFIWTYTAIAMRQMDELPIAITAVTLVLVLAALLVFGKTRLR